MEIVWATLLVVIAIVLWALNLLGVPGNWLVLLAAAVYAYLIPNSARIDVAWPTVLVLGGLAALGEMVELLAGAVGARQLGGSRRAAVLALIASMVGALLGAVLGLPVPYIGSVIGAIFFAGVGALVGTILGEIWAGRTLSESWRVGLAAFAGRLLGTAGKMIIGAAMLAILVTALVVA